MSKKGVCRGCRRRSVQFARFALIVLGCQALCGPILSLSFNEGTVGADTSVSDAICLAHQLNVSLTRGPAGAGHSSSVILVRNLGPSACRLKGYPVIRLLNAVGIEVAMAIETPTGFSGGLPAGESIRSVDLHKGEVASAVMEGTDTPPGSAATCPSYRSYTITLPGVNHPVRIRHAIQNCSGLYVHPLVIGFNGTFPSGEVVGLAPACRSSGGAGPGPFVQIEALSGSHVVAEVTVFAGSEVKRRFEIVLKPGRYRIQSDHDPTSAHVIVHAGESVNLGSYGSCLEVSGIPTTTTTLVRGATPRTTDTQLTAIAFFNPSHGYGLFTRSAPSSCKALVGSTTNGGANFLRLTTVTSWPCSNGAPAGSVAFDDHGDGFLYGPDLFVTHDGGVTWTASQQPGSVISVEALGMSIWMVEAECPTRTGSAECQLLLLESTDGGRVWSASVAPAGATASELFTRGGRGQTWLVRTSQSSAYLMSNPANLLSGRSGPVPLWFTSDGATTWSSRSVNCAIDEWTVSLSAASDGTLLAVCAGQPSTGVQVKSTERSTDGGVTWTTKSACVITSGSASTTCVTEPPSSGYLDAIDAVSANTLFLVGGRSSLLVSRDGGSTWQTVRPVIGDTSDGSSQVVFFNSFDGIVLANDGSNDDVATLFSTSDGGVSWKERVPQVG
jgi:photosystem II stability/assembly factor-like uncharacterized protein